MNNQRSVDRPGIAWTNTIFLIASHLMAGGGLWYLIAHQEIPGPNVSFALWSSRATGLSVTFGYQRLFAHRTVEAKTVVNLLLLLFGTAALQNSARKWGSDHRRHHNFVDTDRDPYDIGRGFWYAHMGWVFEKNPGKKIYEDVPDLIRDRLVMFQEKYYIPLAIAVGFVFPTLVASLWGDPLGGFLIAGWVRLIFNEHCTFSINSFVHIFGKQPYSDQDTSRDNWFFAFVTYGEGYHNSHHKFPFDYRNGIKFNQWDPSKWTIAFLSCLGQTQNLHRSSK